MPKYRLSWPVILALVFLVSTSIISQCFSQESITLTTYYPSPYGVYKELRLYPNDSPTGCGDAADEGKMYYDDSEHQLKVCIDDGFGIYGWQVSGGLWTQSGNNLYPNDTNWKVGIGTTTPGNAKLQVNGAISRQGSTVTSPTQVNLGVNSTTQGMYTTVSGGGSWNRATANKATVSGGQRNKSTDLSCTIGGGEQNTASKPAATVGGGIANTASGHNSVVSGGSGNVASHTNSTVCGGLFNTAAGDYSVVCGGNSNTVAPGRSYSWAGGRNAKVNHVGSFVWADSQNPDFTSGGFRSFNLRAQGGIYFSGAAGANSLTYHDVAEYMDTLKEDGINEGELVSIVDNGIFGRSKKLYDENLIGVVSGGKTCSFHMGNRESSSEDIERLPITLIGPVYVKVCQESGSIKIGAPITSSSFPGTGMRAGKSGKIIGYAMEECDFKDKKTDEILVFVNVGYYVSESDFEKLKKVEEFENKFNLLNERIDKLAQSTAKEN
ncbi:MAG: hypothetical protein KAS99_04745 [Candidatus Omnitrophica bacterium]|nr:hypothetical protein [Candidatus Omnitrophota bacterium]